MRNILFARRIRIGLALAGGLAALTSVNDARAQGAGSAGRPLPDVLLLVDNSGSMERKPDNQLPSCTAGDASSEPNRWAMLLQAMTGNFQPYFSCASVSRSKATNPKFATLYGINGQDPYDVNYALPFNMPMTGGTAADACVIAPWKLPGATGATGVGAGKLTSGGKATDYPDDALVAYKYTPLMTNGGVVDPPTPNTCTFDQNNDGQLDVTKAYARFALMMFDSLTDPQTGLNGSYPNQTINTADPFTGQWSYLRHSGNPFFSGPSDTPVAPSGTTCTPLISGQGANGMPGTTPSCCPTWQEVGARNAGAPPWEGRLIPFADPDATLYDLDAQNALIQQTLLASRPFGATPIDGMMDDARDFLFNDPAGPKGDSYKCRDRYIVLLTDGAPNLNLRPNCAATNGVCPYPNEAFTIADQMYNISDQSKVTTFVIGFSVNGTSTASGADGFPAGLTNNDCKTWFDTAAGSTTDEKQRAKAMQDACDAQKPPQGTTADACCQLNKIAYYGSGQGAYFAESQADIVLAFGRIMANIIKSAATATIPAFSPMAAFSTAAFAQNATSTTKASSAQFIASYIPSSQTPWSGELDRTRSLCEANISTPKPPDRTLGDFQSENLAMQSHQKERIFISAVADKANSNIDSAATLRPFANNDGLGTPVDTSTNNYLATEVVMKNYALNFNTDWPLALNVTDKTCRKGRAVGKGGAGKGTVKVPALTDPEQCSEVIWGFATAYPDAQTFSGSYNFNIRCNGQSTASGTCSITGNTCVPSASTCKTGETCIPDCAALGAVYHSNPTVTGPPQALLREEGFRNYQAKYAKRRSIMYTATTDGLLHAFDAMLQAGPDNHHELWAFAPPAVLPHLAANYPGGNQIVLDGAPVVKEVVWDRTSAQLSDPKKWHTTLVAGLGTVGGYYAMNVTDGDCSDGGGTDNCLSKYESPAKSNRTDIGLPDGSGAEGTPKRGPHFLWQLTDVPAGTSETAKVIRDSLVGSPKTKMTALFGKNTSTPAIGMVQIKPAADQPEHQVGIAILPGGYDDPPIAKGSCARATHTSADDISDTANGAVRANVRQWAKGSCTSSPVPGRNLTIVRLDTGEILRIFGRVQDTPVKLQNLLKGNGGVNETLFDSPIVGTPVIYPDAAGVPIQKIFVGDADGTLWRIDVSSTDPKDWKATLFADLIGKASTPNADASQPIQVAPVLSTDDAGNIIINAATGDQENIVASDTLENFVYALRETRDSSHNPHAQVLWYKRLTAAERVTGPMTVFDKTLYFASYQPIRPTGTSAGSCDSPGKAWLWGMDYINPKGSITAANGGADKWCLSTDVDTTANGSGLCKTAFTDREQMGQDIIPGVALTATQSCVGADQLDEYGNSMFSSTSQAQYSLSFGIARPNSEGFNKAQAARKSVARPLPRMATQISSWALVLE
jgi:type IV pilus assembly protein PilY1